MAEVPTNVCDILFPSPPALKDIVAISIALRLWRQEINTHRIKNTLDKLDLQGNILSSDSMPSISSTALSAIEKYVKRVGLSIKHWLEDHFHLKSFKAEIFNDFIDFVADFDGSIHYVWTAKRFVQCEKIENLTRFHIACKYCFEEDILRIWPSVSSHESIKSDEMSFYNNSLLTYWICRARNQMYKLPRVFDFGQSLEEEMVYLQFDMSCDTRYSTWTSMNYFWSRINSDARIRVITDRDIYIHKPYRYLLGKFNDVELEQFANSRARKIIYDLLCDEPKHYIDSCDISYFNGDVQDRTPFIMAIWAYIKKKMNGDNFFSLVRKMILRPYRLRVVSTSVCRELWDTAPQHLKTHVIQRLLSENSLLPTDEYYVETMPKIDGSFLLAVLSDASAEDKSTFWDRHWRSLITVMFVGEYDQLIRLCFSNDENEIVEFKQNSLSELPNVRAKCVTLLNDLSLEELNELLNFCYPADEQKRKNIQQSLLVEEFKVDLLNISMISPLLNNFINDAYDDLNLASDFKTQLLFSPSTKKIFSELIDSYGMNRTFEREANFIDVLAPSQQVARDLKKLYFILLLQQKLIAGNFKSDVDENEFRNFISECASSEDEVAQLKTSLSPDEIVQNVIRNASSYRNQGDPKRNSILVNFLEWYFITPQERGEFEARYADDDVFVMLISKIE